MRVQAVWALGEIGSPKSVLPLRAMLLESSRQMGELAARALLAIGPDGIEVLTMCADGEGPSAAIAAGALASGSDLLASSP